MDGQAFYSCRLIFSLRRRRRRMAKFVVVRSGLIRLPTQLVRTLPRKSGAVQAACDLFVSVKRG